MISGLFQFVIENLDTLKIASVIVGTVIPFIGNIISALSRARQDDAQSERVKRLIRQISARERRIDRLTEANHDLIAERLRLLEQNEALSRDLEERKTEIHDADGAASGRASPPPADKQ